MANPDSSLLVGDEPLCPAAPIALGQDETKWHSVGIEDTLTLQCTSWNGLSNEVLLLRCRVRRSENPKPLTLKPCHSEILKNKHPPFPNLKILPCPTLP